MEVITDEKCTCPTEHIRPKSWRQRIKERFIKPSRIIRSSSDSENKESEEEDGETSSRSSSGIGTLSTRSKVRHEEVEVESYLPPAVTESQTAPVVQSGSRSNLWISKTNLGVFAKLKKSTADIYDKISLAENDDRDFEDFPNTDDIEEEEVMKVKDWQISLNKDDDEEKQPERVQVLRQVLIFSRSLRPVINDIKKV